jgi:hypothetical protein
MSHFPICDSPLDGSSREHYTRAFAESLNWNGVEVSGREWNGSEEANCDVPALRMRIRVR